MVIIQTVGFEVLLLYQPLWRVWKWVLKHRQWWVVCRSAPFYIGRASLMFFFTIFFNFLDLWVVVCEMSCGGSLWI